MKLISNMRWSVPLIVGALVTTSVTPAYAAFPPPPPPPEPASEKEVEALNNAAVEKFQAKEYDEAARLFEEAYSINPEPNYLFNIGRIYEESGDLPQAVEYYERFMNEPAVELEAREIALERVRVLKEIIRENEAEEAAKNPPPPVEEDPDPLGKDDDKKKQPPMRIGGIVLLSVGAVVLGAGAGFGAAASGNSNALDDLNTLETRDSEIEKGRRNAIVADSMFIAGGALALTGVILIAVSFTKRGSGSRAALSPTFGRRGAGVTAKVRF